MAVQHFGCESSGILRNLRIELFLFAGDRDLKENPPTYLRDGDDNDGDEKRQRQSFGCSEFAGDSVHCLLG